jgi:hypothetical protein
MTRGEALTKAMRCPFCGSAPTVEYWHGGGTQKTAIHCVAEECHASPMVTGSTPRVALDRWNTRAPLWVGASKHARRTAALGAQ